MGKKKVSWDEHYIALLMFHASFSSFPKLEEEVVTSEGNNVDLGAWLEKQRIWYFKYQNSTRPSRTSDEEADRLVALDQLVEEKGLWLSDDW